MTSKRQVWKALHEARKAAQAFIVLLQTVDLSTEKSIGALQGAAMRLRNEGADAHGELSGLRRSLFQVEPEPVAIEPLVEQADAVTALVDFLALRGNKHVMVSRVLYQPPVMVPTVPGSKGLAFSAPAREDLIGKYVWCLCYVERFTGTFHVMFEVKWDDLVRQVNGVPPTQGPYR